MLWGRVSGTQNVTLMISFKKIPNKPLQLLVRLQIGQDFVKDALLQAFKVLDVQWNTEVAKMTESLSGLQLVPITYDLLFLSTPT